MRLTAKFLLLLLASSLMQAAPLNGLYFGLDNMRGFSEVYWWFLSDGRVLRNTLPAGLKKENFDAACQQHSGFCGTYTLSGDKLTVQYKTGAPENWTYKVLNGGIQLNYLILTPVEKYPAGAKLNGTFDRPFSAKVGNTAITSPTFYTFKPDGTFTFLNVTGVETANRGGSHQTEATGTYTLRDNSLMIVKNGKTEEHMIFPVAGGSLNIDGMVYKKR